MRILWSILSTALIFIHAFVFAHGEDKPGPHGGFIRMPGPYHTELVPLGPSQIKVYLLDIAFANPSVRDSRVTATFRGAKDVEAVCQTDEDGFLCAFDPAVKLNAKGLVKISSTRENQRGNVVEYPTPLTRHR